MAVLDTLPAQSIIDGLKGVLDFYSYKGIPVVRTWPRSPGHDRAPAVEAQWAAFSFAASEWNNLSPEVQQAYNTLASGTAYTARDWQMRAYLTGVFGYPKP